MKKYLNLINECYKEKKAIPQFNINNLEWAKYVLEECESKNYPVFLGVSPSAAKHMGGYRTVRKMVDGLIEDLNITIPVILHLDHGKDFNECQKAIDASFDSIMIDASQNSIEDNIKITNDVLNCAPNLLIEAELGVINSSNQEIKYTTVEEIKLFLDKCDIDLLAPALGSVHGFYKEEPNINFSIMKQLKENNPFPLVLHGGTGLSDEIIKECIENGVVKINFNTELQSVWYDAVSKFIMENKDVYDPRKIIGSGEAAIKEVVAHKIDLLK